MANSKQRSPNFTTMLSTALLNETSPALQPIVEKVKNGIRISTDEALLLYKDAPLGLLASLANGIRERMFGNKTFFNRNFHIEPTNKCVFDCKFCAYSRNFQQHEDAWELNRDQMLDIVRKYEN